MENAIPVLISLPVHHRTMKRAIHGPWEVSVFVCSSEVIYVSSKCGPENSTNE